MRRAIDYEDEEEIRIHLADFIENAGLYARRANGKLTILQLARTLSANPRLRREEVQDNIMWQITYQL